MSWTEYEDNFLKQNVGKITYKKIAIELKKGRRTITDRVKKLGLMGINLSKKAQFKKMYSVNESFFDEVNLLSSYYAGLIASDGCIRGNTVSLTQSKSRLYAVERFADFADFDGNIYRGKHKKGYDSFSVVITSKRWQTALKNNFNIVPKKSLILRPPNIKSFDCKLSFIVGLIDGDGTSNFYDGKSDKKTAIISLCGTYEIVDWVYALWEKYCESVGNRPSKGPRKLTDNNTWEIRISGIKAIKFYKLIRDLEIPKMESKWNIFENEINDKGEDFYLEDLSKNRKRGKNGRFCKNG